MGGLTGSANGSSYDRIWEDVYGDMQDVGPTHRHMRRLLRNLLAEIEYSSVLEIGCGAGHNFDLISDGRRLVRLSGADVSTTALERAARVWPAADLHELDVERTTLPDAWDLVFCSLVLEHLADDEAALRNMRAMTRGSFVACTIAGDFERYRPWEEQMGHVRNYRPGELEEKLGRAGFAVERAIYWGFPFFSPIARRLQNRVTATAEYGARMGVAARLLYWIYWLNSGRRGDLLLVRARPN